MPIIFKKHLNFEDSCDDNDNNSAVNSFLKDSDDSSSTNPPLKKRKLNNQNPKHIHSEIKPSKANKKKPKKSKSMLKRLRIKKTKEKRGLEPSKAPKPNAVVSNTFDITKPSKIANEFQKLLLQTLKTTSKELDFEFKACHFIELPRHSLDPITFDVNIGSLDVLHSFLNGYFSNIIGSDSNEIFAEQSNDKRKEWIAYTKSMQIMIISPSVRKAIDTIKHLQTNIKVKHSFVHKKQLQRMSAEEYESFEESKEESVGEIGLRVCELFGKHRKIEYQTKELLNKSWHCGVGGINRISKLCKAKHLTLKKCELIVIDMQRNVKNMSVLDMNQQCKELCEWLRDYALIRVKNRHTKIALL